MQFQLFGLSYLRKNKTKMKNLVELISKSPFIWMMQ